MIPFLEKEISLIEVVETVEGADWVGECLMEMDDCNTCQTHDFWKNKALESKPNCIPEILLNGRDSINVASARTKSQMIRI